MTTLMSNPSGGGGGRKPSTNKDRKAIHPNKNDRTSSNVVSSSSSTVNPSESNITNNNQVAEDFKTNSKTDKFQPTAEQMRIASLMSDKKDDDLKPKIEKIVELTGASRDDAAVALYDCDNDMPKAIEMILDGESFDSEWQSTGRKKKTKSQGNQISDVITNGNKSTEKSARSNNKNNTSLGTGVERSSGGSERGQAKSSRGGGTMGAGKSNRKKDFRANNNNQNENVTKNYADGGEDSDSFANTNNAETVNKKFGNKRDGAPRGRGRGATRGRGMARGSRTFMNRGIQNSHHSNNSNNNSDGFPNSIETWTNNAVETVPKTSNNDLNTMTVGNWSDVAANEEWSEEDWTSAPMETKVFTPSTKVIPEKEETKEQQSNKQTLNHNPNESQVYLPSSINKAEEPSQPTMSAIISNNIKRPSQPTTAGQALLQQIQLQQQQSQSVSQNSSLNQYNMSQYSKQATQSIKNLVGITQNLNISNDHTLENLSKTTSQQQQQQQQPSNQNRIKVQNITSKIPETAVEMPSSDPMTNLSLHFSGLEFGFQVNAPKKQPDNKPMPLSTNATANDATYPSNPNQSSGNANTKNLLQGQVLPHQLNDSLLNNDHRNDKSLNPSSYTSNKPTMVVDRKSDYNSMNYKSTYPPLNENVYSSGYQPQQQQQQQPPQSSINAATVSYYSTTNNVTNQVPFGTTNAANNNPAVNLMVNNNIYNPNAGVYNTNNNVVNASKGIRDLENNANSVQPTPQSVSSTAVVSNKTPYETSSNVGTSLSQISSSTSTTNAIKNTLSSTGKTGMHNMPPGVNASSMQATQVITNPYLISNPTMTIPYYSFDMSFPATAHTRDPNYATSYAPAEVKYNRNSEPDVLPVSSQAASAAQTATQPHNAYFNHFPANYYLSYNFPNYFPTNPPIYPVAAQAQNQASTSSAFKPNQAANYGSHSYNSGYDSMGTTVPQTQDYVNKPYQHAKQITGTGTTADMTTNPQNMYNKAHPQLNKNYDKQGFQAQAPPMNLANPAQPAANMSSAYNNAYMLPHHQQPMHHSFTNAEPTQQTTAGANQRNIMHKNISSNTGATYAKFSWN